MENIIIALISGGAVAALVEGGIKIYMLCKKRKAAKEDKAEEKAEYEHRQRDLNTEGRVKKIEKQSEAQSEALRYLLYDRIRLYGQAHIAAGSVSFEDRRLLHNMHGVYHYGLGGNGDLDQLMEEVDHLPLKQ